MPHQEHSIAYRGALIVNADDWGRDSETTNRIQDCAKHRTISSVSGMVFMEDSERAAEVAREAGIDAGLHLNLTTRFSSTKASTTLLEHQERVGTFLLRHRLAPAIFHPWLVNSFEYVVTAQLEEFSRIYGGVPKRIDGHHHMHLSPNVLLARLLPSGTTLRRSFSFQPSEKSLANRKYRQFVDYMVARRHRVTDFFFTLDPRDSPARLRRIFSLASTHTVEVATHPVDPVEYRFLVGGEILEWTREVPIAPRYCV